MGAFRDSVSECSAPLVAEKEIHLFNCTKEYKSFRIMCVY